MRRLCRRKVSTLPATRSFTLPGPARMKGVSASSPGAVWFWTGKLPSLLLVAPSAPRKTGTPPPGGKTKGQFERGTRSPTPAQPGVANEPQHGKQKGQPLERATPGAPAGGAPEPQHGKQKAPPHETATPPPGGGPRPETQGARERTERTNVKPATAPAGAAEREPGKPAAAKKKGEASPSATPH